MGNTTVLMSSPEYFKVEYSINPWMVEGVSVNLELAKQQWENLKTTIEQAGASVEVVPPHEQYPDLVFTANSGIINEDKVLIANLNSKRDKAKRKFTLIGSQKMDTQYREFHLTSNLREEAMHLFWMNIL